MARGRHGRGAAARRFLCAAGDAAAAGRPAARRRRADGGRDRLQSGHLAAPVAELVMNMACTLFGLTPEEALAGMTINAARALGLAARGRHDRGRQGRRPLRLADRRAGRAWLLDRHAGAGAADRGGRMPDLSSLRASVEASGADASLRSQTDDVTDRRDNSRHIRARRGSEIKREAG